RNRRKRNRVDERPQHGPGQRREVDDGEHGVPTLLHDPLEFGHDTFAGDLLARLGVRNVYAGHPERYPRIPLDELNASGAELVVLPDEPYRFTADDGPEAFPALPAALVDGRLLTWYGPSLAEAARVLPSALR
ncbi:helical backbone metal receptor, partial [Streptomyces parvus]|uniref:helical backbone metal receptor n=1 Tax=Streptomyces parvus TaxID=66428 RepID=UPI0021CC5EB5